MTRQRNQITGRFESSKTKEVEEKEEEQNDYHLSMWESMLVAVVYISCLFCVGGIFYLLYLITK